MTRSRRRTSSLRRSCGLVVRSPRQYFSVSRRFASALSGAWRTGLADAATSARTLTGACANRVVLDLRPKARLVKAVAGVGKIGALFDSQVIRLAPLAPDVAGATLTGEQLAHRTLRELMARLPVKS